MIIRTLSFLATLAALSAVSAPVYASDEGISVPTDQYSVDTSTVDADSPDAAVVPPPRCEPWMRDCRDHRWDHNRRVVCYSQNVLRRTFSAYGNSRTPRWYLQRSAVEACRRGSFPLIRSTCRFIGCQVF